MSQKIAVIAIGGNSLVKAKGKESIEDQYQAVYETCLHIADMIEQGWTVAIGHGNGPQVGFVLRRSEIAFQTEGIHEIPLDVCGADTQGATGYMLQQNLYNEFLKRGIEKEVATVVTQVEVDAQDAAFKNPTKPIGSFMDETHAKEKKEKEGWSVVEDAGRGWRRVVASPLPKRVVEEPAVRALIKEGMCVITVG
ncbi:MAG: carbamate kinase, partial [Chloroflexota bacterium]